MLGWFGIIRGAGRWRLFAGLMVKCTEFEIQKCGYRCLENRLAP
jgi:hypothetical protein